MSQDCLNAKGIWLFYGPKTRVNSAGETVPARRALYIPDAQITPKSAEQNDVFMAWYRITYAVWVGARTKLALEQNDAAWLAKVCKGEVEGTFTDENTATIFPNTNPTAISVNPVEGEATTWELENSLWKSIGFIPRRTTIEGIASLKQMRAEVMKAAKTSFTLMQFRLKFPTAAEIAAKEEKRLKDEIEAKREEIEKLKAEAKAGEEAAA